MVEKRAKIQDQVNEPILGGSSKRGGGQTHADELLFFFPLYFWELGCDSVSFHKGLQRIKEIEFGINADEKKILASDLWENPACILSKCRTTEGLYTVERNE